MLPQTDYLCGAVRRSAARHTVRLKPVVIERVRQDDDATLFYYPQEQVLVFPAGASFAVAADFVEDIPAEHYGAVREGREDRPARESPTVAREHAPPARVKPFVERADERHIRATADNVQLPPQS